MTQLTQRWWKERRGRVFTGALGVIFIVLLFRLFFLQIVNRPEFLQQANANRLRVEIIEPTRGLVYDRHHRQLLENRPSYTVFVRPWTIKKNLAAVALLSDILEIDTTTLVRRISKRGWFTFQPAPVLRDIEFAQLARLETQRSNLPGVAVTFAPKRAYPLPEAVHLLGYVGERGKGDLNPGAQIRFGLIGKHGIELVYEPLLGGEPGVRYVQMDAQGREYGTVPDHPGRPPKRGWDLHLNVDGRLQRYAYDQMAGRAGAVVAIDPRNGAVLTLLSLPDYDPTVFAGVLPKSVWDELSNDPRHPLLNRTTQGKYPPGSTYKMAILAAGIETGIVNDDFRTTCRGGMQLGQRFFRCWKKEGHGTLGWRDGLKHSCDVFYYTLGLRLGIAKMHEYSQRFGFGAQTGIDLDVESSAIVPSVRYLDRKYGQNGWSKGQALNISIGQGDVLVTPVQLAVFAAAIASGQLVRPRIAERVVNPANGEDIGLPPAGKPLQISAPTLAMIREAMKSVVNEPGGTAYGQNRKDIVMAGKTGTAQNPHGDDHGLFVGFAPYDDPIIAVAVVVEHGLHGSTSAAPVACNVMEYYIREIYPGPYASPKVLITESGIIADVTGD